MEQITYRKTLDVHKNGSQFLLQGFETADNLSRVIEISLMASGDAIDFPLERIIAMMYVTTPGADEPSINECTIKDNKVVYNVLPIVVEGITTMQLKLIATSPDGAKSVLASPKFSVEVTKSNVDDESAEQTTTFTALEDAMAKAKTVYDERFLRMELSSDCIFRAFYGDGTVYETDVLQKLFLNGNVLLSESFAHGKTGVRAGEDTDNSMYYSNVSKSESLNAKAIMENSEEILEEVRLHGVYTAFSVDFETGEVEYVSPSFKFKVNKETGDLDAEGQTHTFEEEIYRVVEDWLAANGVVLHDLQSISEHHTQQIDNLQEDTEMLKTRVTPIELGGTGAEDKEGAKENLEIPTIIKGSYTGDGEESRFIDLGFTPDMILLVDASYGFGFVSSGAPSNAHYIQYYGGVALQDSPSFVYSSHLQKNVNIVGIVDNGFEVSNALTYAYDNGSSRSWVRSNEDERLFNYIAIKF